MPVVDVVKYDGGAGVYAWKYPKDSLATWTQLIVNESQIAILYRAGEALDTFGPGRHTLETGNIPLLKNIANLPYGGKSPFSAEVWFINTAHILDVKWGTPSPLQLQDPEYGLWVPVRSFGQFGIQITDAKLFMRRLVGTLPSFDTESLSQYFRGLYLTKIKDTISGYLIHRKIGILKVNAYLEELSKYLGRQLAPTLAEYGISLLNFYVNDISIPEDNEGMRQLGMALAKRAEMDILGSDYTPQEMAGATEGICPHCSFTMSHSDNFCRNCGRKYFKNQNEQT